MSNFHKNFAKYYKLWWQRLKTNLLHGLHGIIPIPRLFKILDKKFSLFPLSLPHPSTLKIVDKDASDLGFGDILKQTIKDKNVIIRYYYGEYVYAYIDMGWWTRKLFRHERQLECCQRTIGS